MPCPACGAAASADARFCPQCGTPLNAPATGGTPLPPPAPGARASGNHPMPPPVPAHAHAHAAPEAAPIDQDEAWRLAIGPKAQAHYLDRFARLAAGGAGGWHWPAALFTSGWLLYRKLYGRLVLYIVASNALPLALALLGGVVGKQLGADSDGGAALLGLLVGWVLLIVWPGLKGNAWVYRSASHMIADVRSAGGTLAQQRAFIASRGGTNGAAVLVVLLVIGVPVIGILAAIALPAYQDYTVRARISQAVVSARQDSQRYAEAYAREGHVPVPEAIAPPASRAPSVREVQVEQDGALTYTLGAPQIVAGLRFQLTPEVDAQGQITGWRCHSVDVPERYMPHQCRDTTAPAAP